jgi:tmRNA-binding protein
MGAEIRKALPCPVVPPLSRDTNFRTIENEFDHQKMAIVALKFYDPWSRAQIKLSVWVLKHAYDSD